MFAFLVFIFTGDCEEPSCGLPPAFSSLSHAENITRSTSDQKDNYCLLPPYPEHGSYTVDNHPSATPGERYSSVKIDISCDIGYLNNSTVTSILCINGYWSSSMHPCVRDLQGFCELSTEDLSVMYRCLSSQETRERSRDCDSLVPTGSLVIPVCSPTYFSDTKLPEMHCRNGMWDYNPICKPECGLTTQHRQREGASSNHLELPWHAIIYEIYPYDYPIPRVSGSLITATKIITSARWLYNSPKHNPSILTVAVNKMYKLYNDTRDKNSQYSDIAEIIIQSSYRDFTKNYEDNIAIVVVKTPFFFHSSVRPVCLDFDYDLDITQAAEENSGQLAHWSTVIYDREPGPGVLNISDLSYIKNEDCNSLLSQDDRRFLTKDKFCAKLSNETWSGSVSNGNGLVFLEPTTQKYFLRGVLSDYYIPKNKRNILLFTSIKKHEDFIKQHL